MLASKQLAKKQQITSAFANHKRHAKSSPRDISRAFSTATRSWMLASTPGTWIHDRVGARADFYVPAARRFCCRSCRSRAWRLCESSRAASANAYRTTACRKLSRRRAGHNGEWVRLEILKRAASLLREGGRRERRKIRTRRTPAKDMDRTEEIRCEIDPETDSAGFYPRLNVDSYRMDFMDGITVALVF